MHAVARSYSGVGAKELMSLLEARVAEIEKLIMGVDGVENYTLFRTDDGGIAVTVCQHEAAAQKSLEVARKWVADNAAHTRVGPPKVMRGDVILACGKARKATKAA